MKWQIRKCKTKYHRNYLNTLPFSVILAVIFFIQYYCPFFKQSLPPPPKKKNGQRSYLPQRNKSFVCLESLLKEDPFADFVSDSCIRNFIHETSFYTCFCFLFLMADCTVKQVWQRAWFGALYHMVQCGSAAWWKTQTCSYNRMNCNGQEKHKCHQLEVIIKKAQTGELLLPMVLLISKQSKCCKKRKQLTNTKAACSLAADAR